MAEITAATVKELRERTGAGMMDCKKALAETNGEMEAAIDWLRAKGLSAAAKKAGRTASEGLVGIAVEGTRGAAVEVNSETDFVAKNEQFQEFVRNVSQLALQTGGDVEALGAAAYPAGGTVSEALTENIAKIGENQSLRRAAVVEVGEGAIVSYVHNQVAPGLGKMKINDFFTQDGVIRADGLLLHSMYLLQVQDPKDGPWDLAKVVGTIPGDQAYPALKDSGCPLVAN